MCGEAAKLNQAHFKIYTVQGVAMQYSPFSVTIAAGPEDKEDFLPFTKT